jgi:hypothetical protein
MGGVPVWGFEIFLSGTCCQRPPNVAGMCAATILFRDHRWKCSYGCTLVQPHHPSLRWIGVVHSHSPFQSSVIILEHAAFEARSTLAHQ